MLRRQKVVLLLRELLAKPELLSAVQQRDSGQTDAQTVGKGPMYHDVQIGSAKRQNIAARGIERLVATVEQ